MAEWSQHLLRLMKPGISAFAVESLLCRHLGERKRDSVQTVAEISGGIKTSIRLIAKPIMSMYVPVVKSHLQHMAIRTGNIALTSAISMTDSEVAVMTNEQMQNEKLFQGTMLTAKNLLKQGIISDDEYEQIDTMFRQKYAISLSTLFTDIRLIKYADHGNMSH